MLSEASLSCSRTAAVGSVRRKREGVMAKEWAPELIQKTLQGISIPARPQILVRLDSELAKDDPDPAVVVRLISSDVVLSAAMLKTVNSPFFGLPRRISSVAQAVSMLGLKMTARIVNGLVLRMTMGGRQSSLERFWDTAEKVAGISGRESVITMTRPFSTPGILSTPSP
jgi:HD-like signal output (HDOD) protein